MLWTIFVILLVLWLLGMVSSYTLGGFIHILLVLAVVAVDHFRNTPGAVASRDGEFLHPRRIHSHTSSASRSGGSDSRYPRP